MFLLSFTPTFFLFGIRSADLLNPFPNSRVFGSLGKGGSIGKHRLSVEEKPFTFLGESKVNSPRVWWIWARYDLKFSRRCCGAQDLSLFDLQSWYGVGCDMCCWVVSPFKGRKRCGRQNSKEKMVVMRNKISGNQIEFLRRTVDEWNAVHPSHENIWPFLSATPWWICHVLANLVLRITTWQSPSRWHPPRHQPPDHTHPWVKTDFPFYPNHDLWGK